MLPNDRPYLIAETAFHHEGDMEFLLGLVALASESRADAIKFHLLFDVDDYMVPDHPGSKTLKEITLNSDQIEDAFQATREYDLDIIALTNDVSSLNWINNQTRFVVKAVEIHATGINDIFLLSEAAKFKGTVILGTGGATFDEVHFGIDYLRKKGKSDIFLMHGFQSYPTSFEDINLGRMNALTSVFGLPVGYADHTDPTDADNETISVLGVILGFNVVEKHLTNEPGTKRIDAQSAITSSQFIKVKTLMDKVLKARGTDPAFMSLAEMKYGDTGPMRKAPVAKRDIDLGEKITLEDIGYKRTVESSSLKQRDVNLLLGAEVIKPIRKNEKIDFSNAKYRFEIPSFDQFFAGKK